MACEAASKIHLKRMLAVSWLPHMSRRMGACREHYEKQLQIRKQQRKQLRLRTQCRKQTSGIDDDTILPVMLPPRPSQQNCAK
jgi:hypothetical protein